MVMAGLVLFWVGSSYLSARYAGRPWTLGQSEGCAGSCAGCQLKRSCDTTETAGGSAQNPMEELHHSLQQARQIGTTEIIS